MMLLFLAIALGIGLTAYEFSPKTHSWADDHVRAIREALEAHRVADAHLEVAQGSPDPVVVAHHAHEASKANREAAHHTTTAAQTAKTEPQRAAVADSAAKVVDREAKLADIGVGQCDVRSYPHVTAQIRDALLAKLHSEGMTVTGNNPWDIDTHNHDVKLRALWDSREQVLKLIVTAGKGSKAALGLVTVTCDLIWAEIDPILKGIIGGA
jgi:hypothetical protein